MKKFKNITGCCIANDCFGESEILNSMTNIPNNTVVFENGRLFRFLAESKEGNLPVYVEELSAINDTVLLKNLFSDIDNTIGGDAFISMNDSGLLVWEF